jgi:hypothetical protein
VTGLHRSAVRADTKLLVTSKCSKTGKNESFGFKRLIIDHCVFHYEDSEGNVMILLHYVDDLVITTTRLKIRDLFLTHMNHKWKTTAEGKLNRYLGINYRWDETACSCTATAKPDRFDRVRHNHCALRRQLWIECT